MHANSKFIRKLKFTDFPTENYRVAVLLNCLIGTFLKASGMSVAHISSEDMGDMLVKSLDTQYKDIKKIWRNRNHV